MPGHTDRTLLSEEDVLSTFDQRIIEKLCDAFWHLNEYEEYETALETDVTNQVPDRPGDDIAVSLEIPFAPRIGFEDTGNVLRDRGLFRKDRNGPGLTCFHR